jgi:FixJ family two-component response regulator
MLQCKVRGVRRTKPPQQVAPSISRGAACCELGAVTNTCALVFVVDDDESVRESLPDLLRELGYSVQVYPSAEKFLASEQVSAAKVLILDIFLQGMSGPELARELAIRGVAVPIIYITAHTDETVRARLLRDGAVECLFKPFTDTALLAALTAAARKSPTQITFGEK